MSKVVSRIRTIHGGKFDGYEMITDESELPTPVSGEIPLVAGGRYVFGNKLTLTNTLLFPTDDCYVTLTGTLYVALTTQTVFIKAAAMTQSTNINIADGLIIDTTNSKTFLSLEGTNVAGGTGNILITNTKIVNFTTIGTISTTYGMQGLRFNSGGIVGFTTGLTFGVAPLYTHIISMGFIPASGNDALSAITITSGSWKSFAISAGIYETFDTNQWCLNINNSITSPITITTTDYDNSLVDCHFFNTAGLNNESIYVLAKNNVNICLSLVSGELVSSTVGTTTIAVADATTIANLTGVTIQNNQRFTTTSAGVATHTGLNSTRVTIDGNISLEPESGKVNKLISLEYARLEKKTTVTFTNGTNIINLVAHTFTNGDRVCFFETAGTLPAELHEDIIYYIVSTTTDTFQVSYTSGGAAVAFTDDGTPTNTCYYSHALGSRTTSELSTGDPQNMPPKGTSRANTGDKFVLCCSAEELLDIVMNTFYTRFVGV